MKVLISGATGFIGNHLCASLARDGHTVWALSRDGARARQRVAAIERAFDWNPTVDVLPAEALEGVDAIVHLAGESVAGRWSKRQRRAIHDSRVRGTRNLVAGLAAAGDRPGLLVSGSAIGYYGDRGDQELSESEPAGDDFLARVCAEWESEARAAESPGVDVVRLRTGIVLGPDGGALEQMLLPAKLGLGGPLGNGRQWWSWVHMHDAIGLIRHALHAPSSSRALNVTAPEPERQRDFARAMGRVLRRPAFLPAPAFAIRAALGGFASELLSSKRVVPTTAAAEGYAFQFPALDGALRDLLGRG